MVYIFLVSFYIDVQPPSTIRFDPVIYDDASEDKKIMVDEIS